MSNRHIPLVLAALLLLQLGAFAQITIVTDPDAQAPAKHGLDAIVAALKARGQIVQFATSMKDAGPIVIVAGLADGQGAAAQMLKPEKACTQPESLLVRKLELDHRQIILLAGADPRGLMYAELDVADRIGWSELQTDPFQQVHDLAEAPDCPERAVSIYTVQRAYFEKRLYDAKYWDRYFDLLARDRFNGFVLIFGYENGGFLAPPYPYFFNVDGFSDVRMVGITPEQQQKNLASLNRLIEQAHAHGIDVTIGIWDHIYRGGVQANDVPGTEDATKKPTQGLVWGVTADNLIPYTRAALTTFVKEVHGIDGIQFRMHDESGLKNSEQAGFWREIARMMQKEAPNIRFDARAKGLPDVVIDDLVSTGISFRVDTKYWMEQMGMPWHPTHINPQDQDNRRHSYADLLRYPQQSKMHWRLWNGGTARVLLWGDPDYVRRFVETTHLYDGDGFEINEPLCTKMQGQAQDVKPFDLLKPDFKYTDYEFERYWYELALFGRLGYDPQTAPETLDREFVRRFGKDAGPHIEKALNRASWILPRIVGAVYPYSAFPMTRGWAERQTLGDLPHYAMNQGSDVAQFANFQEEADAILGESETAKILPSQTARWFDESAKTICSELNSISADDTNLELKSTISDLNLLGELAHFHAERIRAAIAWCIFQRTSDRDVLAIAVEHERQAVDAWTLLCTFTSPYSDDLMFGNPRFHLAGTWKDEIPKLQQGLNDLQKELDSAPATRPSATTAPSRLLLTRLSAPYLPPTVSHEPVTKLAVGEPLKITATVRSDAGIKWVRLRCRSVNQRLDYDSVAMKPSGKAGEFEAIVPAEQIPPKWDFMYYIEVMDNHGQGCLFPDAQQRTPYIVVKLQRNKP